MLKLGGQCQCLDEIICVTRLVLLWEQSSHFKMLGYINLIEKEGALPATDPDLWSDVGHL